MSFTRGKLYFSDTAHEQTTLARNAMLAELPKLGIAGATVYDTWGVWQGKTEFGFVLEVLSLLGDGGTFLHVRIQLEELAEMLRHDFQQTSVLVTIETVNGQAVFVEEANK